MYSPFPVKRKSPEPIDNLFRCPNCGEIIKEQSAFFKHYEVHNQEHEESIKASKEIECDGCETEQIPVNKILKPVPDYETIKKNQIREPIQRALSKPPFSSSKKRNTKLDLGYKAKPKKIAAKSKSLNSESQQLVWGPWQILLSNENIKLSKTNLTNHSLERAVARLERGGTFSDAAKYLQIPILALKRFISRHKIPKSEDGEYYSTDEVKKIVYWLDDCSKAGLYREIADLLNISNKKFKYQSGTNIDNFMKLNDLMIIKIKQLPCTDILQIRKLLKNMKYYLSYHKLLEIIKDPGRIANMDIVQFELSEVSKNNIMLKFVNVIFTCLANGSTLKPQHFGHNIPFEYRLPEFMEYWSQELYSANVSSQIFEHYIKTIFYPSMVERNTVFPVLLLVDTARINITYDIFKTCRNLKIILISPFTQFKQIISPFELCIAQVFDTFWNKFLVKKLANPSLPYSIRFFPNTSNFSELLKEFYTHMIGEQKVKESFEAFGIFPWNENNIDYDTIIMSCKRKRFVGEFQEYIISKKYEAHVEMLYRSKIN